METFTKEFWKDIYDALTSKIEWHEAEMKKTTPANFSFQEHLRMSSKLELHKSRIKKYIA